MITQTMKNNKKEIGEMSLPLHPAYLSDWYKKEVYPTKDLYRDGEAFCVYVIYNSVTKLYKIGITLDPKRRVQQLETSSGCKMETVLALELEEDYDEPAKAIEDALHKFFNHKRQLGEWFSLDIKDILSIRNLFSGTICGWYVHDYIEDHIKGRNEGFKSMHIRQFDWDRNRF